MMQFHPGFLGKTILTNSEGAVIRLLGEDDGSVYRIPVEN